MKSITHKTTPDSSVNVPREVSRPNRLAERSARAGHWVDSLRNSDVNRLWAELHRIVSNHPLVRASRSAGLLIEEGASSAYTDLTQEQREYLETARTTESLRGNRDPGSENRGRQAAHSRTESVIRRLSTGATNFYTDSIQRELSSL